MTHDLDELLTGLDIETDLTADNDDTDDVTEAVFAPSAHALPVAVSLDGQNHVEEEEDDDDDDEIDLS